MGQVCQICNHPQRLEIDREIVKGISHTKIARMFNVSNQAVRNHAQNHLSRQMVKHQEIQERLQSQGLLNEIEDLLERSKAILTKAEKDGKLNIALSAIRETRGTLELLCRIAATLHQIRAQELEQARLEQEQEDKANTILIDPKMLPVATLLEACGYKELGGQNIGIDLDPANLSDEQLIALVNAEATDPITGDPLQDWRKPIQTPSRPKPTRTTCPEPENLEEGTEALGQGSEPPPNPEPENVPPPPPEPKPERAPAGTWGRPDPFRSLEGVVKPGSIRTPNPELARLLGLD